MLLYCQQIPEKVCLVKKNLHEIKKTFFISFCPKCEWPCMQRFDCHIDDWSSIIYPQDGTLCRNLLLWLKEIVDQNSMKWHQQRQEHDEDQSPQHWERSVMEKDFRKRLYVSQCTNKNTSVIHGNKFILRYCITDKVSALNVLIT